MSDLHHDMEAIRTMVNELDIEPSHAVQVCRIALSLFDQTPSLHRLGARERDLLEAAALLHDTGYRIGVQKHHKHSRDVIMGQDLPGFDEIERKIVACIARYHRKAEPKPEHTLFGTMETAGQEVVLRLAAILRIADGLDRLHIASAQSIRVEHEESLVRIIVEQRRPCPTDLWGGLRKCGLFERVFNLRVELLADKIT
ncbi:MAG TPA: HD domain-containing protein [Candidatus Hydrogenedentes bacterium]|nr:HD domain-containing protein [Candidatus Hydrogenedentota bacterium]